MGTGLRGTVWLVVVAFIFVAVPADADVQNCTQAAAVLLPGPADVPERVRGTVMWFDGSCGGTGVAGRPEACPSGFGQFCGPVVDQNAFVSCAFTAFPGSAAVDAVAGVDVNGDGVLDARDGILHRAAPLRDAPFVAAFMQFFAPAAGRIIAYPVGTTVGGDPTGQAGLECH